MPIEDLLQPYCPSCYSRGDLTIEGQLERSLAAAKDSISSGDAGGAHTAQSGLAAVLESYVQQERSALSRTHDFPPVAMTLN